MVTSRVPASPSAPLALDKFSALAQHRSMHPEPTSSDLAPGQWKPNPPALWFYIMIGVGRILVSGAEVVLIRLGVRR